mgnify:FL=1
MAFGSDANTLSGYSGFIWNDTTHRLLIDPGATAPDSPLTIRGNGTVLGATGIEYVMNFNSGAGSYPGMFFGYHSANNLGVLGVTSTGAATDLAFYMLTSGTWSERMRLTNAGRLGVGCTPSFYIHSAGNAAFGNAGVNTAGQTVVDASSSHARIYQFNSGATLTNLIQTGGVTYFNGGSVAIGATSAGAKLDVVGTADAIQLRVTGFTTQGNVVAQFLRNDGATNTAGTILTLGANTTGTAAALFGLKTVYELESSTTASQTAGYEERLWTDATHASRTVLYRGTTTGNATQFGFYGAWSFNAVSNTAITIIPNGTGDVASVGTFLFSVKDNTSSTTNGGVVVLNPGGGAISLLSDGTDTVQITCAADGSVTIARSAGTHTFSVSIWGTWQ